MTQTSFHVPRLTETHLAEEVSCTVNGKAYRLIRLRPTLPNTLVRLAMTCIRFLGIAFLVMLVIYLPDYVFDYARRGEDFLQFFFIYLGIMAAAVLAAAMVTVLLSPRTLYIDPQEQRITFSRVFSARTLEQKSIRFSDVVSLDKQITANPLTPSRLTLIAGEQEFVVAEIGYGHKDMPVLYDWLKPFFPIPRN